MSDDPMLRARLQEYQTLRDETLRRIDSRNQILSFTLGFAAAMFTLALSEHGFISALLIYPLVAFFFSTSFAYNSLMLIQIGRYLRKLEEQIPGLGWASHLGPRYRLTEFFELVSSAGLFLCTELIGIGLYLVVRPDGQPISLTLMTLAIASATLTLGSVVYPWFFHKRVLREG